MADGEKRLAIGLVDGDHASEHRDGTAGRRSDEGDALAAALRVLFTRELDGARE